MKKEVQFTEDFGIHKKGDKWKASRDLMAMVVREGVAKYIEDIPKKAKTTKAKAKK